MNDKEMVRVASVIQAALWQLRKSRYKRCAAQLSLFAGTIQVLIHDSRNLAAALSRDWFAAAERSCKNISGKLREIPLLVSNLQSLVERRHRDVPNLSGIAEELRALQQEFDDVEFNREEEALCVTTEPITLEDIYLGEFRIELHLDKLHELYHKVPYFVVAIDPHPAATDETVTHPHVSNDVMCEGDGAAAIKVSLETGRLVDFFVMVRSILTTYNPGSPYVSLADWYGVSCYECGYVMDNDSSYYCTYCENVVCDECSTGCASCGESVCKSCAATCEICERSLCPQCAKARCSECESVCCESCLEDGLCPGCREERDSNHEEETETTEHHQGTDEDEPQTATIGRQVAGEGQHTYDTGTAVQPGRVGEAAPLPGQV